MHDESGLAVDDRLGGAAAVPRDLRHAARGRLEEDDAEALLLEPAPAVAAQHGEHVAHAVERGQVVVGDAAEEPDRRCCSARHAFEPLAVAAAAADGDLEVGRSWREARRGVG